MERSVEVQVLLATPFILLKIMSPKQIALLIIDVQKSATGDSDLPKRIEALQNQYRHIFVSQFQNKTFHEIGLKLLTRNIGKQNIK